MENADPIDNAKQADFSLSGKMMLICIVILFIVIVIMICLHIYIRWYLRRARHRQHLRRSRNRQSRSSHFVFYIDPALTANSRGLEASVISSLPVFTFSPNSEPVECAVCLSEFEDGETGRVLPTCKHSFHIECIDMWFESHSTCPLCRVHVESPPQPEVVVNVSEAEPGSSSEEVNRSGAGVCSSSSSVGKSLSSVSLGTESVYDSASSSFRSPMSRMLSFKRILSRERKASSDVERGSELTQ